MPFLHPNEPLKIATLNGFDGVLLEPLPFRLRCGRLLRVRTGAGTDGLSSPKWIKCDLQTTNSYFPSVAHDGAYRGDLEESPDNGQTWQRAEFNKMEADAMLHELAEDNFVLPWETKAFYDAVAEFGQQAWDGDAPLRNRSNPV